jgi:hypothetical protein
VGRHRRNQELICDSLCPAALGRHQSPEAFTKTSALDPKRTAAQQRSKPVSKIHTRNFPNRYNKCS